MTMEQIQARLKELVEMKQSLNQQILQAQVNLQAIGGAEQDCQYWLEKLQQETPINPGEAAND